MLVYPSRARIFVSLPVLIFDFDFDFYFDFKPNGSWDLLKWASLYIRSSAWLSVA